MSSINAAPGEYYHVFNRGVEKRKVFLDEQDYRQFLFLLAAVNAGMKINSHEEKKRGRTSLGITRDTGNENLLAHIGAYCLMPNHFHLLVYEHKENGLAQFLHILMTAYTMYFNTKYDRAGALFQGKTKKKHADTDKYLKYLFSYIHLNPLDLFELGWKENGLADMEGCKKFLKEFKYSSYIDYLGNFREENHILQKDSFPNYFSNTLLFEKHINDFLTYPQRGSTSL